MVAAVILTFPAVLDARPPARKQLRSAGQALDRGDYGRSLHLTHDLLYPEPRIARDHRPLAREILAASYHRMSAPDAAEREWRNLLAALPDYALTRTAAIVGVSQAFERLRRARPPPTRSAGTIEFYIDARYGGGLRFEGKSFPSGQTGALRRPPGHYVVVAYHEDEACFSKSYAFELAADGPRRFLFSPGFRDASVMVLTGAPSSVQAGGRLFESAEVASFKMHGPVKRVHVVVDAPGFVPVRRIVTLRAGHHEEVHVRLSPKVTAAE